ncbi:hypothetical protein WDW89_21185 [Deltaproteobacteria bacterium TL4]
MLTLTIKEAKKSFSKILNDQKTVAVKNPTHTSVIVPFSYFQELERAAIILESRQSMEEAKGQKRYSDEEVDQLIAKVLEEQKDGKMAS